MVFPSVTDTLKEVPSEEKSPILPFICLDGSEEVSSSLSLEIGEMYVPRLYTGGEWGRARNIAPDQNLLYLGMRLGNDDTVAFLSPGDGMYCSVFWPQFNDVRDEGIVVDTQGNRWGPPLMLTAIRQFQTKYGIQRHIKLSFFTDQGNSTVILNLAHVVYIYPPLANLKHLQLQDSK